MLIWEYLRAAETACTRPVSSATRNITIALYFCGWWWWAVTRVALCSTVLRHKIEVLLAKERKMPQNLCYW